MRQKPWLFVVALTCALAVLRLEWILHVPDIDMDAYGHVGIGRGLCHDPTNIAAHWVWLPLYHYLIAGVAYLGGTFVDLRFLASSAVTALPLLVYWHERQAPRVALVAASFCAIAAVPNELGVSAQQEALFGALILGCVLAIEAERATVAAGLLSAACLIRYEAWGALGLVLVQPFFARRMRVAPIPWRVALAPIVAVGAFIVVHRLADGKWLSFLRELYRYTHMQRGVYDRGVVLETLWFPLIVPLIAFGPAVLLAPLGVRGAWRRGWIVPLGIYVFLLLSYLGKGALGGHRYYGSLVPFFAIAMARAGARFPRFHGRFVAFVALSLLVTTGVSFVGVAKTALTHASAFRDAEANVASIRCP